MHTVVTVLVSVICAHRLNLQHSTHKDATSSTVIVSETRPLTLVLPQSWCLVLLGLFVIAVFRRDKSLEDNNGGKIKDYAQHVKKKTLSRSTKEADKTNVEACYISFDLQQNLLLLGWLR